MQITNQQFLQLVAKQQMNKTAVMDALDTKSMSVSAATETESVVEKLLAENTNATIYSIADEVANKCVSCTPQEPIAVLNPDLVEKVGGVASSTVNSGSLGTVSSDVVEKVSFAITIEDLPPSKIANIKQIIYDLHFKSGETDPTDPEEPDPEEPEEPDVPKPSFIEEFDDVDSMFEWMSEQDPTITKENGLTRAQLVNLTHNDKWEDANQDFFGSLNRVFNVLDKNSDDKLTVEEIKALIGEQIGESAADYQAKVSSYAAQLEAQYQALDMQGKLEFAIERTREYLEAAGLTLQLNALNRLTNSADLHAPISVGQIAFADLNPNYDPSKGGGYVLGAYSSMGLPVEYKGMKCTVFVSDNDSAQDDCGLTLDENYYASKTWYELVDTLVHELTHATASQFSHIVDGKVQPVSQSLLDQMKDCGILSEEDYTYYSANINTLIQEAATRGEYNTGKFTDEKLLRFYYLTYTGWGEYSAYQTDADYADSIGGDVFDSGRLTTAVNGDQEKSVITNHIDSYYNQDGKIEAEPDWKWWTYA